MLKVLELFAGIGACSKALTNLGIEHEIVDAVEIDKYAVKSFNAIHGTNFEPQDITTWNKNIECDLIMHGSPCQDFSIAGKQQGGDKDSGTRSSLLYETIRIVAKLKPKYVVWENVKNVISKKHRHNFDNYLSEMEQLGYANYYQVLNAKDYGIPQNRERVFTISIKNNIEIDESIKPSVAMNFEREKEQIITSDKDIYQATSDNGWQDNKIGLKICPTIRANNNCHYVLEDNRKQFIFPPKQELKLRLKDMLEDEVDERYYLSDDQVKRMETPTYLSGKTEKRVQKGICRTLAARDYKDAKCVQVGNLDIKGQDIIKRVYSNEGVSPSLTTMEGGNRQPKIISRDKRLQQMLDENKINGDEVLNLDLYNQTTNANISQCLTEPHHNSQRLYDGARIRKLTPRECWRLMGFNDEDFDKASQVNSNSQLYKQAGNSIVVNVLVEIFRELLCKKK